MHSLAARGSLIGLLALRHLGFGPHVHSTALHTPTESQLAELWTEPTDQAARDLFAGAWGPSFAPKPDAVYIFVDEKKSGFSPKMDVTSRNGRALWDLLAFDPRSSRRDLGATFGETGLYRPQRNDARSSRKRGLLRASSTDWCGSNFTDCSRNCFITSRQEPDTCELPSFLSSSAQSPS